MWLSALRLFVIKLLLLALSAVAIAEESELDIALSLADMLQASRTVIASNQSLINNPELSNKALSGKVIVDQVIDQLNESGALTEEQLEGDTRLARYLQFQADSIAEIIDENQKLFNQPGLAFKGFVPAVFARLVNERFSAKASGEAQVKVTAPMDLIRNRRARPDEWELDVLESKFKSADWQHGQRYTESTEIAGREAFRVMVPEYYGQACLACHGTPKAELDITGYPKEGADLDQLAGAISITIFK